MSGWFDWTGLINGWTIGSVMKDYKMICVTRAEKRGGGGLGFFVRRFCLSARYRFLSGELDTCRLVIGFLYGPCTRALVPCGRRVHQQARRYSSCRYYPFEFLLGWPNHINLAFH